MTTTALRYTILAGDTYSAIATGIDACAGISWQAIAEANPAIDPDRLAVGQLLDLPARDTTEVALRYTVQPGDTLSGIAGALGECAGVSAAQIEQANPGVSPTALRVGQVIGIPATGEPVEPVEPVEPPVPAANVGYWDWTWLPSSAPAGCTMGLAFSGWADPTTALQDSAQVKASLVGERYLCLGGGNADGAMTQAGLASINAAIKEGAFAGYDGLAFDVEEGDSGLAESFAETFSLAKRAGFKLLVTVSHSAPYGIADAAQLMESFFADANIDFLSPQLYTTGQETANDYATSQGVQWSSYAKAKAAIAPSLVKASMYADAERYFKTEGVALAGYIRWSKSG